MSNILIRMENISKQFNGHTVLKNVNFSIKSGEVCSLLGENGAGKTTLMKILAGVNLQDTGKIIFNGKEAFINSTIASQKLGIRMIFQEPQLIDFFTVEKNIFIGKEICYKYTPFINRKFQLARAKDLLSYLQTNIDVNTPVEELTFAQKKMVEIAKALLYDVKVLILDEVTAAFTEPEIMNLFGIIQKLKESGVAVIFISHKIEEVLQISDRIVILRDGEVVDESLNKTEGDLKVLIEKMAGEDYVNRYPKTRAKKGKVILELKNVSNRQDSVKNANLYLRRGEIVGVAGLQGAGKSSLIKIVAGIETVTAGEILLNSKPVQIKNPYQAIKRGIVYLSDNNSLNLNLWMDVSYNITLANLKKVIKFILINSRMVTEVSKSFIKRLNIKVKNAHEPVRHLSRGTQQKVALSKCLYADADILVLYEPSVNIDINSKVELYNIMNMLCHAGKSILMASSDLRELIGMCDRIYVMFNGAIVSELQADEANSIKILQYASGELHKS